jgi:hypothetical protein
MEAKDKAKELVDSFYNAKDEDGFHSMNTYRAKQCALIAVENEYKSLREQLVNLRACKVIESEKTFLFRMQELIDKENEVKNEINNL